MKKKTMLILLTTVASIILLAVSGYFIYNKVMSVSNFSNYLSKYQKEMSNCILNEEKKSEYDLIVKEAEDIINAKKSKEINKVKKKLINFKEMILKDNESLIEKYKSTIESYNLDRLSENSKESVGEQIEKIELIQSKNNYIELEQKYIALIDFIENALIEDQYKNLDGYWISDLDGYYMNLRIDLKNNTYTTVYSQSEGHRLKIEGYEYDKENDEYKLKNIFSVSGPQGREGDILEKSVKYIDENHIEIDNIKLYKVSFEEAVYHSLYFRLMDAKVNNEIDLDMFTNYNLPEQYTVDSKWNEQISDDDINEIILNKIYSKDVIDTNKKLAITYGVDPEEVPSFSFDELQIAPNIKWYSYGAMTLQFPTAREYFENNDIILGEGYLKMNCYSEGIILPNGIVIQSQFNNNGKIEDNMKEFKDKILSYYK